jgi:uncharacterized protein (TIGR02996 family)
LTTPVPALPDSYLRAILALPDDDGPRLCAADWWDEQGAAERAEFVRVQCELARRYPGWSGEPAPDSLGAGGSYAELRRRERELKEANGRAWGPCLSGAKWRRIIAPGPRDESGHFSQIRHWGWSTAGDPIPAEFRRGFVEELTATAADFLAHADALTAACPLRRVRLTTWPEVWVASEAEGRPILPGNLSGLKFGLGPVSAGGMYAVSLGGVASVAHCLSVAHRLLADRFPGITFELSRILALLSLSAYNS